MDLRISTFSNKLIRYLSILLVYFSCDYSKNEELRCILNCNPAECFILDEEKCECVSDIECLREKFCRGDVEDCGCKEEDGGKWCIALTGDSIKTWKIVAIYNYFNDDTVSGSDLAWYSWASGFIYRLDHKYFEYSQPGEEHVVYLWEFDDVYNPTKIIYKYNSKNQPGYQPPDFETQLTSLNPDTLILTYHVNGTIGNSDVIYIPGIYNIN